MVSAKLSQHSIPVKDREVKLQEALKIADPWANGKALGLTENCIRALRPRYLKRGPEGKCVEPPEELFRRVPHPVAAAEKAYDKPPAEIASLEQSFFDMMVKGIYMPN